MSVFLDSSALIAYHRVSDKHHLQAREMLNKIHDQKIHVVISSHVLEEVVTFIASRDGPKIAFDVAQRLMSLQNMDIVWVQRESVETALQLLRQFSGLSLCDALTAVLMKEQGIGQLASFDSDFDQFNYIERLF